jgi:hypothetical protein
MASFGAEEGFPREGAYLLPIVVGTVVQPSSGAMKNIVPVRGSKEAQENFRRREEVKGLRREDISSLRAAGAKQDGRGGVLETRVLASFLNLGLAGLMRLLTLLVLLGQGPHLVA